MVVLNTCKNCDVKFENIHQLEKHNKSSQKSKCELFNSSFISYCHPNSHVEIVHETNDKVKNCKKCNNPFINSNLLENHTTKVYECEKCSFSFQSSQHMKKHTKSVHESNTKIIVCEKCNKSFKSQINLQDHMKHVHEEKTLLISSLNICRGLLTLS